MEKNVDRCEFAFCRGPKGNQGTKIELPKCGYVVSHTVCLQGRFSLSFFRHAQTRATDQVPRNMVVS